MTDTSTTAGVQRTARRRIIKGSFAAPAVLTVSSGSALARTSSGCVARDAQATTQPAYDSDNATWLRLQAYDYKPNGTNKVTSYWIKGSDVQALATAAGVGLSPNNWITSSQYLCVVGGDQPTGSQSYVAGSIYSAPPPSLLSTSPVRYYAVLFDSEGNITGISQGYGTGGAVHKSCWTSFKPL